MKPIYLTFELDSDRYKKFLTLNKEYSQPEFVKFLAEIAQSHPDFVNPTTGVSWGLERKLLTIIINPDPNMVNDVIR